MSNVSDPARPAFVDDPHATEIFATDAAGFFLFENNVIITFETARANHGTVPGVISKVVSGRIVLPLASAQRLVVGLNDFLEKRGVSPSEAIKGDRTAQ